VLDAVGGPFFEPAVKSLCFGGRLTGLHSHERVDVDLVEIYSYERHVTGLASVSMDGAHCANIFDQLTALFDRGILDTRPYRPGRSRTAPRPIRRCRTGRVESGRCCCRPRAGLRGRR
jgi:hypothetical protein